MFKWVVGVVVLVVGGWYLLVDGAKLDERKVREFYQQKWHATYSRDPDALCQLLSKKAQLRVEMRMSGKTTNETLGRDQACLNEQKWAKFFEEVGEKAGGMLTIEYEHQLQAIEIAPNGRRATVKFSSTLKMGESFMEFFTTSTDTLESSWRQVRLVEADSKTRVQWVPGALVNPEKYFRSQ